jgi:hypothetical protein
MKSNDQTALEDSTASSLGNYHLHPDKGGHADPAQHAGIGGVGLAEDGKTAPTDESDPSQLPRPPQP